MKTILLACLIPLAASAQYTPSASGSTVAAAELNSKASIRGGSGPPSGNCTANKEFYVDLNAQVLWYCVATNVWAAAQASLGFTPANIASNLSDLASASTARTNLGLAIGANVEAWSSNLDALSGKTAPSGGVVGTTDTQTLTNKTLDGVTPAVMSNLDATSSIQTQLNGKQAVSSGTQAPGSIIQSTGTVGTKWTFPGQTYLAWGDSLTAGNEDGSGVTYPNVLNGLLSRPVINGGAGGQTSTQIAVRAGCVPTTATISGGTIPSSGGVTVTFTTGFEPVTNQGPSSIYGSLDGVYGVVSLSGSTYTFTRTAAGSAVSVGSASFIVGNGNYAGSNGLLWMGRNNFSSTSQVESDIAACAATYPQHLVLSILNAESEGTGTSNYTAIVGLNSALSAVYGQYYTDVREWLVGQYNPANPVDVIDHANDTPPYSLRAKYNGVLSSALSSASACPVAAATNLLTNQIMLIGSEYIYLLTTSAGVISTCTRGFAGTTATTYANSTAFTVADSLHLSGAGYTGVANYIASVLSNLDPSVGGQSMFGSPPPIGTYNAAPGFFTTLKAVTGAFGGCAIGAITTDDICTTRDMLVGGNMRASGSMGSQNNCVTDSTFVHTLCFSLSGDFTTIQLAGKFAPGTDATYDLGYGPSTLRWRNAYLSGTVSAGGTISANGGTNILYRCTVAGTLRAGQVTTVPGDCGTAVATGYLSN